MGPTMNANELIRKCVAAMIVTACAGFTSSGQIAPAPLLPKELSAKRNTKPASEFTEPPSAEKASAKPSPSANDTKGPVIVVGFPGGFVGHDNMVHSPVQIAARLLDGYPAGVYVKVFENHRRENAHREILNLLDADHDGVLSDEERRRARIIIYGISWGGSETVALARELDREHIPVLLTVQVDSVAKIRQNDEVIPPNVSEAANFFQVDGLLHGQTRIRAADEKHTTILGNFRMSYKSKEVACRKYPWYDKIFVKYHTEIECDPAVWSQVESLIRARLP